MRSNLFKAVVGLGVLVALQPARAQIRAIDPERLLTERFGFTTSEVAQARSGQAIAKLLPAQGSTDVGVFGAIRIDAKADRVVSWFQDIASFRKAAELGVSRRLSSPPLIADFADLALDSNELAALKGCRPGRCDLLLGDTAIGRFQTEIDWTAADSPQRASLLLQQLLLAQAQAYLKGGDQALGAIHDDKKPRARVDDFHQVLWQSKALYDIAPALTAYLEGFPAARLSGSEQFLYWAKASLGSEASITLHQLVVYHAPGGEVFIVDKQLFASRDVDAAVTVISLAPAPDGKGFYALAGARARSRMLNGLGAKLLRGRVESVTRDTAAMYLNWLRASLALG